MATSSLGIFLNQASSCYIHCRMEGISEIVWISSWSVLSSLWLCCFINLGESKHCEWFSSTDRGHLGVPLRTSWFLWNIMTGNTNSLHANFGIWSLKNKCSSRTCGSVRGGSVKLHKPLHCGQRRIPQAPDESLENMASRGTCCYFLN